MTQEEKSLLLKDLSARQFYGTKVLGPWKKDGPCELSAIDLTSNRQVRVFEDWCRIEDIKPYLRPLSSMTKEEKEEFENLLEGIVDGIERWDKPDLCEEYDWLNTHHFDYRGLIEKGLALEAPKGIYNIKEK